MKCQVGENPLNRSAYYLRNKIMIWSNPLLNIGKPRVCKCGATDGALVDVNKLLSCRNLTEPEFEAQDGFDYVLGIDVARSQKSTNNRSSVGVIKIQRNLDNTVRDLSLVNLFVISNALSFDAQAIEVKKIQKCFKAKMCVIDINGLGVGLLDVLLKTNIDPKTGETYPCWKTINTDHTPENDDALEIIYALTPQSSQSRITVNFMDLVESGRLRLLEKRDENSYSLADKNWTVKFAPYLQTDNLVEEATNLKLKHLNNGGITVEKVLGKIDKDRYSSVAYGLWWVMEFDNNILADNNSMIDFMLGINGIRQGSGSNNATKFINSIFK
ncbi:MAG: hypothetical protein WCO84_01590 [bacterium]